MASQQEQTETIPEGTVARLWLKRAHRGPMDSVDSVIAFAGSGLEGDANRSLRKRAKPPKRQVVLIEEERWQDTMADLGEDLDPQLRRANILVRGLSFFGHRERVLQVGPCRLLVWGECPPCRLMDDAHAGLQEALKPAWRAGVFAEILDDGEIAIGDAVAWAE